MRKIKLTADDRLDIMELPARYAEALDTLQPDQLPEIFTDDAVWEIVDGRLRLVGLDDIMEFMGRPDVHPGAHLMTNIYIAGTREDAELGTIVHLSSRGVYPVGPSDRLNPTAVFYGRYDDDVVRTDDGWRIRHRRYEHGT